MVEVMVNGRRVRVPQGTFLLEAVRSAGVTLPTLCHHEGVAPYGACRLCMVTITEPRAALVASCAYPVEEGLVVDTEAPTAVAARCLALEFLLGCCPESDEIRKLAAQEGVTSTRFSIPSPAGANELCVLCGLCVRVCREVIGAAAISFVGRGRGRRVAPPFDMQADACIGCGACAEICPTGAVEMEDRGNRRFLRTWNTEVELQACPECGAFFAPKPMAFLEEMIPEVAEFWTLCPDCRRQRTSRQYLQVLDDRARAKGGPSPKPTRPYAGR
jgi:bidirectional [NiFe] hydrogenase diaphorase subunit